MYSFIFPFFSLFIFSVFSSSPFIIVDTGIGTMLPPTLPLPSQTSFL